MDPLTIVGLGSSIYGGIMGSKAAKKAAAEQRRMFERALKEYRKAQKEAKALGKQAQTEVKAARAAVRQQAETSRRESVAGQQRAETLARRSAEQQAAQQQLTAYSRGMAGTTIGMGAMAAAARDVGLQGGLAAMRGAQQRGILSQQLGGQLASLRGQSAGLYQQQAAQRLQSAGQLTQLMGSYQPIVDTGMSQVLGTVGGSLFGLGMYNMSSGGAAGSGTGGLPMGSPMMGQTLYGPGFGTPSPFMQPNAQQFGFTPYQFGSGGF